MDKLKEVEPKRARLTGEQVQLLLSVAGGHRALLATAIMAGGLRVSELTHLRWRDLDLRRGVLNIAASKTAAGLRQVILDRELVQLLREHKLAAEWSQPNDFVFAGRIREKPRERNSVRTRILYGAIEKANQLLAAEDRPPLPDGITFHALRRTYGGLLGDADWAETGRNPDLASGEEDMTQPQSEPERRSDAATPTNGSDGTRTRDLRRDRPAL